MTVPTSPRRAITCAIYTRKSSEEGLDQDFNSLDAQYEACAAYIASQKHEGWSLATGRYDDGGVSAGTLERGGLQRLLADIDAGAIQMIVVYKIDRLTRSLSDFARLIDRLEAAGCSFVSVTQAFNTSTSMGRLTLNVLLSFAQFEREVTAERIRDKLAASKKKGMWMGGIVPLGYDARDRALHVNAEEADLVEEVFALYREHRSVARVEEILAQRGRRTKHHVFANGRQRGGALFSRGQIYHLISNPIYIGKIRHHDQLYEGLHRAIIEPELWGSVQAILSDNSARPKRRQADGVRRESLSAPSVLAGRITDETGDRLTPSHTVKSGRRYRYYVSSRALTGRAESGQGWRLPAGQLEHAIARCVSGGLGDPLAASRILAGTSAACLPGATKKLLSLAEEILGNVPGEVLKSLISAVRIGPGQLAVTLDRADLALRLGVDPDIICDEGLQLEADFTCRKRGVETRIVMETGSARPDKVLIAAITKAHAWWAALRSGTSMRDIAEKEGVSQRRIAVLITLAFLAPDITEAILQGRQSITLTTDALVRNPLPLSWDEQREALAFSQR